MMLTLNLPRSTLSEENDYIRWQQGPLARAVHANLWSISARTPLTTMLMLTTYYIHALLC